MAFPLTPSDGQTTIVNGVTYQYNSTYNSWTIVTTQLPNYTGNIGNVSFGVTALTVAGNVNPSANLIYNLGNVTNSWGNVVASNVIVTSGVFYANGTAFGTGSAGSTTYANANVAGYLPAYSGPLSAGTITATGNIVANASTPSISATTGALVVPNGGVGVGGNLYVAGNITGTYVNVTITSGSYTTTIDPYGNLTVGNGIGNVIAGNVFASTIGNLGAKLVGDGAGITNVAASQLAGTASTSNVSLQSQITTTSGSGIFYPTFSNIQTGNSGMVTSTTLSYQPSTGNLTSTFFVGGLYGSVNTPIQGNIIQFGNLINLSVGNGTILQGNVIANSNATSSNVRTGAIIVPYGGIGVAGASYFGAATTFATSVNSNVILSNDGNLGNINIGTTTSNIYVAGNLTAGNLVTINGLYWSNGVSFATSVASGIATYSNANVQAYLPLYSGNVGAANIVMVPGGAGMIWANGVPAGFGNTNVGQYLNNFNGNMRAGNVTITGNLTVQNVIYTNQEIVTLTDIVQGNLTANANTAVTFGPNGYVTTGAISAPSGGIWSSGNIVTTSAFASNVGYYWAGNGQVYGYSNVTTGAYLNSGATTITANLGNIITANGLYWANGTSFTAGFTNFGNANVAAFLPTYTGNIQANGYFWANGFSAIYSNADAAGFAYRFLLPGYSGNLQAGNILVSNVGGLGGNLSAANVLAGGYFWSNGAPFITSNYGNANVAAFLPTFGGLAAAGRVQTTGNINVGGNLIVTGETYHAGNISVNSLATQSNVNVISGISYQNTNLTFTATPFAPIANSAVVFSGTFGNFTSGTTYYVLTGATTTAMTVSTTPGGTATDSGQPILTAATGVTGNLTTIYSVATPSYGTTSGALVLTGGMGLGGNLNVGGATTLGNGVNLYKTGGNVLSIVGNTFGDGGTTTGANALVYINQTNSWSGSQPWALYVTGYSYLNGFRINGGDAPRALHKAIAGNLGFSTSDSTSGITFGPQNGTTAFAVYPPASGASIVNYIQVTGAAVNTSPIISALGTNANIDIVLQAQGTGNITTANTVRFTGANTATSTTTGALQVTGGMSAQGNIYANAFYTVSGLYWAGNNNVINVGSTGGNPTGASGQMQYNQGGSLAAANLLYYSGNNTVVANSGVSSANTTSGAFQVVGGIGVTGNLWAGNVWSTSLYTGSGVFWSGNLQPIYLGNVLSANNLIFTNSTTNTLQVNGGANIGNLLTVGNTITATGNIVAASGTASTNTTTGALVVVGGLGVSGNVTANAAYSTYSYVTGGTPATNTTSGALQVTGGASVTGNLYVGGNLVVSNVLYTNTEIVTSVEVIAGNLVANSGTPSNGPTTGAFVAVGGIGASGNINAGGNISVTNYLTTGANITSQGNIIGSNFLFNNGAAITAGFVTSNFTGNMTVGNLTQGNIKAGVGIAGQGGTIYVSASTGNDSATNAGTFNNPFATIKAALAVAQAGQTVQVGPGVYTENNPITVPAYTSLLGNDLRTVFIQPQNPNSDLIWVNPGVFINGFTLRNYNASGFAYPSTGNIAATVSPYIQNITSKTTAATSTAVTIDGNLCSSGFKAMIIGFFTIINQNGYGIVLKNSAYSQLVNIYTIGCEQGVVAQSGSFVTLNGSDTSIGNVALRADGYGPLLTYGNTQGYSLLGTFNITMNSNVSPKVNQVMIINGDTNYYSIDNVNYSGSGNVWTVNIQETYTANLALNANVAFYQRSAIIASAHTFEYVGAGNFMANALPQFGGIPNPTYTVIQTNGGHITYTATDHKGNFMIGPNLTINQVTGVISGDSFNRSMFALMTPYILALEA